MTSRERRRRVGEWEYSCVTCRRTSSFRYPSLGCLLQDLDALSTPRDIFPNPSLDDSQATLPTVDVRVATWLLAHGDHELWAENGDLRYRLKPLQLRA